MKKNYTIIIGSLIISIIASIFLYLDIIDPFIIINKNICNFIHTLLGGNKIHNIFSSVYINIFLLLIFNVLSGYLWQKIEGIKQVFFIIIFSFGIFIVNVILFHFKSIFFPSIYIIIIIWINYIILTIWISSQSMTLLSQEIDKLVAKYRIKRLRYDYSSLGLQQTTYLQEFMGKDALPVTKIETLAQLGHAFERERSFLQSLVKNLNQPIMVCDASNNIILVSPSVDKLFPQTKILVGQKILTFLSYFFPDLKEDLENTFRKISYQKDVIDFHGQIGNKFYQISIIPVSDKEDSFNGSICILNDITEMHRRANTDGLTGLWNHRYFKEQLEEEFKRAKRHKEKYPLSLILIDLDYFKSINDTFGHLTGDEVLRQIANLLKKEARSIDIIARYGGEEFVGILPMTSSDGAKVFAERLKKKIENLKIETNDGKIIPKITCSFGITSYNNEKEIKELIDKADRALYICKKAGRNCINIL